TSLSLKTSLSHAPAEFRIANTDMYLVFLDEESLVLTWLPTRYHLRTNEIPSKAHFHININSKIIIISRGILQGVPDSSNDDLVEVVLRRDEAKLLKIN
ncbi:hypothetical protein V1477_002893, partial [Vespula maculifrons]